MAESSDADLLYGVAAIARHLGMPEKPCRHRCDRGQIPTFKIGGTVCARKSSLTRWLAEQEAAASPAAPTTTAN